MDLEYTRMVREYEREKWIIDEANWYLDNQSSVREFSPYTRG